MFLRALGLPFCVAVLATARMPPSIPSSDQQEWPSLKPGTWEMDTTWTDAGGKARERKETTQTCHDPAGLLQTYWGTGILERAGCRFQSRKVNGTEFKLTAECAVRGAGTARSEATLTVENDTTFSMNVRHVEGRRRTTFLQKGKWLATCPPAADTAP